MKEVMISVLEQCVWVCGCEWVCVCVCAYHASACVYMYMYMNVLSVSTFAIHYCCHYFYHTLEISKKQGIRRHDLHFISLLEGDGRGLVRRWRG